MATTETNRAEVRINDLMGPRLEALGKKASLIGIAGVVLSLAGAVASPHTFFQSYLFAYMLVFGWTIGSTAWLMAHHVTGGGWGFILRRPLEAVTRIWWVAFVMWLPLLIAVALFSHTNNPLYIWANPSSVEAVRNFMPPGSSAAEISDASKDLVANVALKAGYLNLTGWICRGGIYFAIFFGLSILLNKWSKMEDESDDPIYRHMLTNLSGGGLLIFLVITTFAGIDWVMSLEPIWYSSLFGAVILVGQGHSTLCLMVVLLRYLVGDSPLLMKYERRYVRDIGNLMLAFTLLWAYVSYDQWLIQYSGNLAGEAPWFIHRTTGGWQYFGALVIILHFALPFLFLLMSLMKVNLSNLAKLAGFLLFVRLSDLFFYVAPTFQLTRSTPFAGFGNMAFLADFGVPLALIGIWLWAWTYEMVKVNAPVVPVFDGRLDPEFSYEPLQAKEAGAHV